MGTRAPSLRGCGCIVPSGMQCPHGRARKAENDQRRPSARARGYTSRWDQARAGFLASHPRCVMVNAEGKRCGQPASVVDHIIPHRGDRYMFWLKSNWQPLCTHCHASRKQSLEARGASQTSAKQAGTAGGRRFGTHPIFSSREGEQN